MLINSHLVTPDFGFCDFRGFHGYTPWNSMQRNATGLTTVARDNFISCADATQNIDLETCVHFVDNFSITHSID